MWNALGQEHGFGPGSGSRLRRGQGHVDEFERRIADARRAVLAQLREQGPTVSLARARALVLEAAAGRLSADEASRLLARMECREGGELLTLEGGRVTSREIRRLEQHVIDTAVSAAARGAARATVGQAEREAGVQAAQAALGEGKHLDLEQRDAFDLLTRDLGTDGTDEDRIGRYAQRISDNRQRHASIRHTLDHTPRLAVELPDNQPLPIADIPAARGPSDPMPEASPTMRDTSHSTAPSAASDEPRGASTGNDTRRPRRASNPEPLDRVLADPPEHLIRALGPVPSERIARERWERQAQRLQPSSAKTALSPPPPHRRCLRTRRPGHARARPRPHRSGAMPPRSGGELGLCRVRSPTFASFRELGEYVAAASIATPTTSPNWTRS